MKKYFTAACISLMLLACSKKDKGPDCPLQTYHMQCEQRYIDIEFGGYITGTLDSYFEAHCPSDAADVANGSSYDFAELYQQCSVVL